MNEVVTMKDNRYDCTQPSIVDLWEIFPYKVGKTVGKE
jgi:hypothetical protein